MTEELQERIVSLFPSESLKDEIRRTGFRLSDSGLLISAFRYAPDFQTRMELLALLESRFTGELKLYAARLIETQRRMLDEFMKRERGVVFELHIREEPDAYDERYLCASYDAALQMIVLFYREYDGAETAAARYAIVKRLVFSGGPEEVFAEDELGRMELLPGRKIRSVDLYAYEDAAENCDGACLDCRRCCVACGRVRFPRFLRQGDAVKYIGWSGAASYGIVLQWEDGPCEDYYVLPLASAVVHRRDFENFSDVHEHIPAPVIERLGAEELPEGLREDYAAWAAWLREDPRWM